MRGHPRANGSTSRWKKLSTYTQARSPPPRTLPPLPPPDLDEEGRVDNQRNTPHNTPLTVQLTVATSGQGVCRIGLVSLSNVDNICPL